MSREIRNIEKIRINTFDNNNPPVKNQPVKFAQQNYPYLKNLNFVNSGTGSREIDLLIGSDSFSEFVSVKVNCGTGDQEK